MNSIPFNLSLFMHVFYRAFCDGIGPSKLPSPLRRLTLLVLAFGWMMLVLVHKIFFRLDQLFFPGLVNLEIKDPLFVVGVPRSGTTFLHRLLVEDSERFTSIQLWEIIFAPSILQKLFYLGLARIDKLLGAPLAAIFRWLGQRLSNPLAGIHQTGLFDAEEDEYLHAWSFSTVFLVEHFPYYDLAGHYAYFDEDVQSSERNALMDYYLGCVRRHMWVFGRGRRFLAKNPALCGKGNSFHEIFPDAQLILMVRTPLETIPSYLSLLEAWRSGVYIPADRLSQVVEGALSILDHFNRYPLEMVDTIYEHQSRIVLYSDLLGELESVVNSIYQDLGVSPSPAFVEKLHVQAERSRSYRSTHQYSLAKYGLTHQQIINRYSYVFERFGFSIQCEVVK